MSDLEAVDLKIISYIQEGLSIATIASRIGVTSPRITQRLNRMKEVCDDPLIYKQGSRYHLTDTGKALLEFSTEVADGWSKFKAKSAKIKSNDGQLRIIGVTSVLLEDAPTALDIVQKEYPHLLVKLIPGTAKEILHSVLHGQADIGLIGLLRSVNDLTFSHYKSEKLVLLVAGTHQLAQFDDIKFSQLERQTFIGMNHTNLMSDIMGAAMIRSGITPSFSMVAGDLESAANMATRSTFGIALTLESVGLRYAKLNNGKVIYLKEPWANIEMAACSRDRSTLTEAQLYFLKTLELLYKN
ncbi:LysR substrate-binding domain-containing protein [Undibacterium sp. Di24W]|uniref:LysR substrate-binding domain-containing protein n=1 Tax=Undibacterium sp. Di24W TaxID=3413033 RepID=UPI003BF289B3